MNQLIDTGKIYSLIGLATKAGKVKSGEFSTEESIKTGKSFLVLVARDASDNTKKLFKDKCKYYEVPCYEFGDKERLAQAIGKETRASISVNDSGFAEAIIKKINQADLMEDMNK